MNARITRGKEEKAMEKIYLANPHGFSEQQREKLLPELIEALEKPGLEVREPFERSKQTDFSRNNRLLLIYYQSQSIVLNSN